MKIIFALLLLLSFNLQAVEIYPFDTGPNSEKTATLPIKTVASTKRSIYWIGLGDLYAGDILQVNVSFQLTKPSSYNYNAMAGFYVTLAEGGVSHDYAIYPATVRNITSNMHHDRLPLSFTYVVPEDMSNTYLTVVGYAAASSAQSGDELIVDQGKGRLSGLIIVP